MLNKKRMEDLKEHFNREKDRLMLQFIKAQGATKKEMDKEPTKTIN